MDQTRGSRMVAFAAIMLMLGGAFNVVDGLVAVANADYFHTDLLFGDVKSWGWFFTVYGAIQFLVGTALLSGSDLARWLGVIIAGFNMLAQLSYVAHYPAWSIAMMVVDVVVIYALVTYGGVFEEEPARESWSRESPSPSEIRAAGPHFG